MKTTFLFTFIFAMFATVSFSQIQTANSKTYLSKTNINQKYNFSKTTNIKNTIPLGPICTDLSANVKFKIIQRHDRFRANVKITGVVKNISRTNFRSSAQAMIQLYEIVPGAAPRLVASRTISNLDAGRSASVSYRRHWNISSPAEGEFPPTYRACIVYDPDIALDNNRFNDDCKSRNNCASRSGTEISRLFR